MAITIYMLQLTNNKYYIGRTDRRRWEDRISEHFNGKGSIWTKKYPPIELDYVIHNADPYDEDKWTLKYMEYYGINNVRGGSYSRITLDIQDIENIHKKFMTAYNSCYNCGLQGHISTKCKEKNITKCKYCNKSFGSYSYTAYFHSLECKERLKLINDSHKSCIVSNKKPLFNYPSHLTFY